MSKYLEVKKLAVLSLISLIAASSVPTSASAVEDGPSDSITVGVVIEEEPNECTDASLTINGGFSELAAILGDGDYMDVSELNAYDLMTFWFRSSEDPFAAFAESIGMSEDEAVEELMKNPGDFPIPEAYRPHVADLDDNGFISVEDPDDIPTFLEARMSAYFTSEFVVSYDAGSCLGESEAEVLYGLLSVSGNPLHKLDEVIDDWQFAGITDFNANDVAEYNGKGEAHLWAAYDSENQQSLSSSEIDFGETFAQFGGTSNVSFAESGSETLRAQVDIAGTQTVGNYRVIFDFDLEVGDQSYMTSLCNSAINSYFMLEPCT